MSWAKTGWDGVDEAEQQAQEAAKEWGPRRFWMPPETSKRIMFLDDDPFGFWEHAVKLNGHWRNYFVCLARNGIEGNCVLDGIRAQNLYYIGFLTVVDFSAWTNDRGETYQYDTKLYGAKLGSKDKPGILKKLRRLKERHAGLCGKIFDVYRTGGKSEAIGDEFNMVEAIDPREIHNYARGLGVDPGPKTEQTPQGKNWVPFNYAEVFKPKSNAEIQKMLGVGVQQQPQQSAFRGGQGGGGGGGFPQQNAGGGGGGGFQSQNSGGQQSSPQGQMPAGGDDDVPF